MADIKEDIDETALNKEETVSEEKAEPVKQTKTRTVKKAVKKYSATDGVPCESIVSGTLGMTGIKSHISYRWAGRGDITEVEYQDIVASIRSHTNFIMKPYFLIRDDDLIEQFPDVKKVYETMYSVGDLKDVLKLPVSEMKATIMSLPEGAKESIKNIASSQITSGQLDSVKKIKALDEIFDTKLILMTNLVD